MSLITAKRNFLEASQALVKATSPSREGIYAVLSTFSELLSTYTGMPVRVVLEADDIPGSANPTESDLEK